LWNWTCWTEKDPLDREVGTAGEVPVETEKMVAMG
jgi:hypothetical protein